MLSVEGGVARLGGALCPSRRISRRTRKTRSSKCSLFLDDYVTGKIEIDSEVLMVAFRVLAIAPKEEDIQL